MKIKRYQEYPFLMRLFIWLRWMPYAYLRGMYWYFRYLDDSFDFYISVSVGDIQAVKMRWVWSGKECMEMMK